MKAGVLEVVKEFLDIPFSVKDDGIYGNVDEEKFSIAVTGLHVKEFALVCIFGEQLSGRVLLRYVFGKRGYEQMVILTRHTSAYSSIASKFPAALWYEREIRDGFGVEFKGIPDSRRLFLHESYPADFHPLRKQTKNAPLKHASREDPYPFKRIVGEGVYQVPVGPVHAGIIEPGHFRFSVIGETIFNLEIRMFWKHRGIEKLAEGMEPGACMKVAQSISGDESIANSLAYAQAVEGICGVKVPRRAAYLRTIFAELERIYSHLGDMAGMVVDVALPVGAMPFFALREEVLRKNKALCGSRFLKGIMAIGGLERDISQESLDSLKLFVKEFDGRFSKAFQSIMGTSSVIDRFESTGIIRKELVRPLNITGPAARASGQLIDTRLDHPYGVYGKFQPKVRAQGNGDVLSRFDQKAAEITDSCRLIAECLRQLPAGQVNAAYEVLDGARLSLVESPRGQSVHFVRIKGGVIDRFKVRTASFCNWQAIEHAVLGNIVPDFPLINKSLNLSYAGTDL